MHSACLLVAHCIPATSQLELPLAGEAASPQAGFPQAHGRLCPPPPACSVGPKQGFMGIFMVKLKQKQLEECGVRPLFYTLLSLLTLCPTSNVISIGLRVFTDFELKGCLYSFRASGIMQGDLYLLCVLVPFLPILAVLGISTY